MISVELKCLNCSTEYLWYYLAPGDRIAKLCVDCMADNLRVDRCVVICEACDEHHVYNQCPYCMSKESNKAPEEEPPKPDWILILEKLEDLEDTIREEMKKET